MTRARLAANAARRAVRTITAVAAMKLVVGVAGAQATTEASAHPPRPPIAVSPSFRGDQFIAPATPVALTLSRLPDAGEGALVIMVGTADVTALFDRRGDRLVYQSQVMPLPSGEHELVIYLAARDVWTP